MQQASLIGESLGNYAVSALIGRGATGTVYLARDTALGRPVALKVLLGALANNPDTVRRFLREAQAAAPLKHANLVAIYEAGVRDGVPFIAMEYVEGESLDRFLNRRGPMKWQNALHIGQQVSLALDCAHQAGIIHRDVKPANILLDTRGRVRLGDFGIACLRDRDDLGQTTVEFRGTPAFMAPEQCSGMRDLTAAADLFALGVTLFVMISGRLPFTAHNTVALLRAITQESPPRLNQLVPDIPDDVARLVAHLLEKPPGSRPASARWVHEAMARLLREDGGGSALPEALNAFIRDQGEVRMVRPATPARPAAHHKARPKEPRTHEKVAPISRFAKVAAAGMLLIALFGAALSRLPDPGQPMPPAPALANAVGEADASGLVTVRIPGPHWQIREMRWAGEDPVLVAAVEGRPGSALHGVRGALLINPITRGVQSLYAPQGGILDPDFTSNRIPLPPITMLPAATELFVPAIASGNEFALLAQHPGEAAPRGKVLYRGPWAALDADPLGDTPALGAAAHPDGHTICLLLRDPATGENYLAERDTGTRDSRGIGTPRTRPGAPILAASLQYSPCGSHLLYMRENSPLERELWILAARADGVNGIPLALGALHTEAAVSPGGASIVVTLGEGTGERLVRVDAVRGDIEAQLGPGRADAASWHPGGAFLVVSASDPANGARQLAAVELAAPHRRAMLTRLPGGVSHGGAVSRDGRWAAAAIETPSGAGVVFVDLNAGDFAS